MTDWNVLRCPSDENYGDGTVEHISIIYETVDNIPPKEAFEAAAALFVHRICDAVPAGRCRDLAVAKVEEVRQWVDRAFEQAGVNS